MVDKCINNPQKYCFKRPGRFLLLVFIPTAPFAAVFHIFPVSLPFFSPLEGTSAYWTNLCWQVLFRHISHLRFLTCFFKMAGFSRFTSLLPFLLHKILLARL